MGDKKQINIDPSMLEILTKTRRKEPKQKSIAKEKIPKLKLRIPQPRVDQTLKSHALKFIRNKQQSLYDTYNTPSASLKPLRTASALIEDEFKNDFDSSISYLNAVSNGSAAAAKKSIIPKIPIMGGGGGNKNSTLRVSSHAQTPPIYNFATPVSVVSPDIDETNIAVESPKDIFDIAATPVKIQMQPQSNPKYGCLKNGKLPTYRTYTKTLRNTPQSEQDRQWNLEPSFSEWMKRNAEMRKIQEHAKKKAYVEKENAKAKERQMNRRKLKKTIRRTYVVGKSSVQPKVSVLVSNKTIRRDIDIKCNKLKQLPLEDVKRDLIKKGFIKVGTSAPPDVLRKMYESVNTMCGDIKNHNADNLVYNYFNDETTNIHG